MHATADRTKTPAAAGQASGVLQRKCACGGTTGPTGECAGCRKKRLQRRALAGAAGPSVAPPIVHDALRSPGRPLDDGVRSQMEPRFGHSFADVRVHADGRAAESARAVDAAAYTVGRSIVFGQGAYAPGSDAGRRLIAHELTHVVQQAGGCGAAAEGPLLLDAPGTPAEAEAEAAATSLTGPAAAIPVSPGRVARKVQRLRRQNTHAGLFEQTRHARRGGPTFAPRAEYDVRIEFFPYPVANCEEIALTQTAVTRLNGALLFGSEARRTRSLGAAEGTEGVGIDRLSGRSSPLYGVDNTGAAGGNAHFGRRTTGQAAERARIEDVPGFDGATPAASRTAGQALSQHFETCAICNRGVDRNAYYGCVSWGYDIDAANAFTEAPFARVSRGTPSADFLAAAGKWNAQTVPVATTDLPIPTHATRNTHMTRAQLDAEITALDTRLKGLAAGHADIPQVTFELRALRDIRDAIDYNENEGYLGVEIRMIQEKVGADQDGIWGYDTIVRVKQWQAVHGVRADGRVGPDTLSRMGIGRAGDYPLPDMSPGAARAA